MGMIAKGSVKWGDTEIKVYEAGTPGESYELIDDTKLASTEKEYIVSDLMDSDDFTLKVAEEDASKITAGESKSMTIVPYEGATAETFTAICTKKAGLSLKRGEKIEREFTFRKTVKATVTP